MSNEIVPGTQKKIDDFENPNVGENFGGSYPRLDLQVDGVSEMLVYVKDTDIEVPDDSEGAAAGAKKVINIHLFKEVESQTLCTSPIGSIFDNVWEDAKITAEKDQFRIKRYADTTKKNGKGKGNVMKVFGLKVYKRG